MTSPKKLMKYIPPVFQSWYTGLKSDGSQETTLPHPDYVAESDTDDESGEEEQIRAHVCPILLTTVRHSDGVRAGEEFHTQ